MATATLRPVVDPWTSVAGEDLAAGLPVYVYDDAGTAKVKQVFTDMGDLIQIDADGYEIATCTIDTDVVAVVIRDRSTSNLRAQVVNVETGQKGALLTLSIGSNYYIDCCRLDTLRFVASTRYSSRIRAIACSVDPVSLAITAGPLTVLDSTDGYYDKVCAIDSTRFAATWRRNLTPYDTHIIISHVDPGTLVITPDAGGAVTLNTGTSLYYPICGYDDGHLVVVYRGANYDLYVKATPIAGTAMAPFNGGPGTLLHPGTVYPSDLFLIGASKWIALFRDGNNAKTHVFSNTGTLISVGNTTQMSDGYAYASAGVAVDTANDKFMGVWANNMAPYDGQYKIGTTPADLITFSSAVQFWPVQVYKVDVSVLVDATEWSACVAIIESVTYDTVVCKLGSQGDQFARCAGITEEAALEGENILVTPVYGQTRQLSGQGGEMMYIQPDATISNIVTDFPIALMLNTDRATVGKEIT